MKIILADGLGTRQDVMAALRKLLEVMRTMSQRSASRQAPTDPCLDWEGMTEHAKRKYVRFDLHLAQHHLLNRPWGVSVQHIGATLLCGD